MRNSMNDYLLPVYHDRRTAAEKLQHIRREIVDGLYPSTALVALIDVMLEMAECLQELETAERCRETLQMEQSERNE